MEADTAAYSGRLKVAREFSRQAMDSAERAKKRKLLQRTPPRLVCGRPCSVTQTKHVGVLVWR